MKEHPDGLCAGSMPLKQAAAARIMLWTAGLLLGASGAASAQKLIIEDEQAWVAVLNQTRLSNRWGLWFDAHLRYRDGFVQKPSVCIARLGPTWYLNNDVRFTAAYAFVNFFPDGAHPTVSRPEHRPWQQVQWFTPIEKARLMQWVRLEERFRRKLNQDGKLAEGYDFNWRIRLNALLAVPLTKKGLGPGGLQGVLNNELFVNFGKEIRTNYFDQNRFFVGLAWQTSKMSQVQLGYLNVFLQSPTTNRFTRVDAVRLFYFHNFDLRASSGS